MEQDNEEKQRLTTEQKQKIKMFAIYSAAVVLGIIIILYIFQPTESEQQESGVNTNVPSAEKEEMDNDKRSIYQKNHKKNHKKEEDKKREQMMMNADTYMNARKNDTVQIQEEIDIINPKGQETNKNIGSDDNPNNAYRNINHTLETFYQSPDKANVEREQMKAQIEELQKQLEITKQAPKSSNQLDDQMALLEKSYELASKHNKSAQTSINSNTVT